MGDWLEDDDLDFPEPVPPTKGQIVAAVALVAFAVGGLVIASLFLPPLLVALWGVGVGLMTLMLWLSVRRPETLRRLAVRMTSVRKGEYKGQWWLGPEAERALHERRMRILAERQRARWRSMSGDPKRPGDNAGQSPRRG